MTEAEALPELRFEVGCRVQCRTGAGEGVDAWSPGTVVKQWYRESHWPKKRTAPYQIKLDDGRLIFAPLDSDKVIQALTGLLADGKLAVTVLTGFLGAGKTTLLNYILKAKHGMKYAIIENEVGAVGVDNILIESSGYKQDTQESITLLDNGCLCCTVRGDLVEAIRKIVDTAREKEKTLAEGERALDGILIETTGLADPGPICKTFYGDPFCSTYCKIDGVITVVDAAHFIEQLTRERTEGAVNESAQQVAFADKILLNKVDAVNKEKLATVMEAIRSVNSFVPVTHCSLGKSPDAVPLDLLLSIDAFDLSKMLEGADIDLSVCGAVTAAESGDGHGHGAEGHGEGHVGGHSDGHECTDACDHGHGAPGHDCGDDDCDHESHSHGHGHGHGHGSVKFRHDLDVGSFVCELLDQPIDEAKFRQWLHELLDKSENLYRYKGIIAMKTCHGQIVRRVLQGVHDMADMDEGAEWPESTPIKSQVVLIGRKLDKKQWTEAFATLGA